MSLSARWYYIRETNTFECWQLCQTLNDPPSTDLGPFDTFTETKEAAIIDLMWQKKAVDDKIKVLRATKFPPERRPFK